MLTERHDFNRQSRYRLLLTPMADESQTMLGNYAMPPDASSYLPWMPFTSTWVAPRRK